MRNKIMIGIIMLVGTLFIMDSCEDNAGFRPVKKVTVPTDCDTAGLSYNNGIDTIINTQCAVSGCHARRGTGPDFTSYANLSTYISGGQSSLFYTCLIDGTPYAMPSTPQPGWATDPCLLAKLKEWILVGAPQ
jgi:hypothetical protein